MPFATNRQVRPLPRRPRPRPARRYRSVVPKGTGQTLAQQLNGLSFTVQAYISFDPVTTANPAWVDITPFVDQDKPLTITPGRSDGLSDANATTCTVTVDNSDGRFTPTNPSGPWFGQIRKGCWLRIDVLPLSGTVSRRFTGFLTALPTSIAGASAECVLSAADTLSLLGLAPKFLTMIQEDFLADPVGASHITGYWPLHEPSGATYVSDISGQAATGQQSLQTRSFGVASGAGITFGNTTAPGFDQQSTVSFAPSGTLIPGFSGNSGALTKGTWLQGPLTMGLCAQITCWINTTVAGQPIWSWADPSRNYVLGVDINSQGYIEVWQAPMSAGGATQNMATGGVSTSPVSDGVWHQISIKLQQPPTVGFVAVTVDGTQVFNSAGSNSWTTGFCPTPGLSRFVLGGGEYWNGASSTTARAFYTGAISDLVIHQFSDPTLNPNWYSPWQAANNGHAPQTVGNRIAHLAWLAGLQVPTAAFSPAGTLDVMYAPTTGTSTAINVAPTAHQCGPQSIVGKNPIDMLREAAHTEGMPLFTDAYGRITVQPSTLRENQAAAFTINALDLDPNTAFADDFQYTANALVITASGQGSLTVNTGGSVSQVLYGTYAPSLDTANVNAVEATSLGAAIIALQADPPPRVAPLAVDAGTLALVSGYGAAWYDAVLAATVSSLVAVTGWPVQSPYGAGGSSKHIVEGWTETLTAGSHLFAWSTSPPHPPTYQCDSPTLGLVDTPGIVLAY